MAFKSAPTNDTYSSHRIPMAWPLRMRPGNLNWSSAGPLQAQDEGMVNALLVKGKEEGQLYAVTRPAMNTTYINNSSETGLVRGLYVWEKSPGLCYFYVVVGTKVYTNSGNGWIMAGNSWVHVDTLLTNATTPVRFTEFIDDTGTKKLVMVDGVEGYVYVNNGAGTKITDVDFPSPHRPWPVFLNGRIYLAKDGTGDIYNSDLNDPASWTAGEFISTEIYPDDVRALVKVDNYILAIGLQGCEYFYDAANVTGTPLARDPGSLLPFGCSVENSIAVNKNMVVMLANGSDGAASFKVIEGFKYRDIECTSVVQMWNRLLISPNVGLELPPENCRGYFVRKGGRLFYNFLFDGVSAPALRTAVYNYCYAYSFEADGWSELQYGDDTTDRNLRYAFPVQATSSGTSASNNLYIAGNVGSTNMAFFGFLDDLYGDDRIKDISTVPFYVEFRLPATDFGTMNKKQMNRLAVVAECQDNTLTIDWTVMWNDQDYNYSKWQSTEIPMQVNMDSIDHYPFVTQLGQFRRRTLRLVTTHGKAITGYYVEVDINKGQQ